MVQNNQTNNRSNAIDSYYRNPNNATMTGIANANNYTPVNARTFLPSIGLTPIESNAITPTSPTPNNNLFSNMNEALEYANRVRQWNREDTDYTVNRGREMAREAARITQPHELNIARIQQSGSLANANAQLGVARTSADAQLGVARINADAELKKIRMENNNAIAKEERDKRNRVFSMRTTVPSLTQDEHRYEMEKNNALYRNNIDVTRINADAQLGVARTNADAQSEVARMNNEYGMQNTLLQGSQRQAELDRQGFIQLQLADIDRGQRGYDNMYSMLNQYTNRPRSNFAYWG